MRIVMLTNEDYCKSVILESSPVEFLVLNSALKKFIDDKDNNPTDILLAKKMASTDIEYVDESEVNRA